MRFIQTLYMDAPNGEGILHSPMGWLSSEYNLMSWTLSSMQLRKYYDNLHLYCNSPAASVLIDRLHLPYTEVHVTHDKETFQKPHKDLWALPKIHTYSMQEIPFLHIDGDVFIFNKFSEEFINGNLLAQEPEVAKLELDSDYNEMREQLLKHFIFFPDCVRKDLESGRSIHSVNAGVLGGSDTPFIKEYCGLVYDYILKNITKLDLIDVPKFCVFFEQQLFQSLAASKGKEIKFAVASEIEDGAFVGLANFWEVPSKRTYLHIIGNYKKKSFYCKKLAEMLRSLYPEQYYAIIALFKNKNVDLKFDLYKHIAFTDENSYKRYIREAIEIYNSAREIPLTNSMGSPVSLVKEKDFISDVIGNIDYSNVEFTSEEINEDRDAFFDSLSEIVQEISAIDPAYLYGRDFFSVNWYNNIFSDESLVPERTVATCKEIHIFSSRFNWGFYLRLFRQAGFRPFPKATHIEIGNRCYTLVIPESGSADHLIFDLQALDVLILQLLQEPKKIKDFLVEIKEYFTKEYLETGVEEIEKMVRYKVDSLVYRKAIKFIK